jgi:hypothetical protein
VKCRSRCLQRTKFKKKRRRKRRGRTRRTKAAKQWNLKNEMMKEKRIILKKDEV